MKHKKIHRITEPLKIVLEYLPNDPYVPDDWALGISINDNERGGNCTITPFGCDMPDLTVNQLLQHLKDVIMEELYNEVK